MASCTSPKTARRFAPTPSGPLHMGSLYLAVADYLLSKQQDSRWFLRIDDLDKPRVVEKSLEQIIRTLQSHGLIWDGKEVYQSEQQPKYGRALNELCQTGKVFACDCSRKKLVEAGYVNDSGICYPGLCRANVIKPTELAAVKDKTLRVMVDDQMLRWQDGRLGIQQENLTDTVGDFVLRRADGVYSYHLATVVDDEDMGITHITRGEDLLSSAGRQIYLQQLLGYRTPEYIHLPLVVDENGQKLAKQSHSKAICDEAVSDNLQQVLGWLGLADEANSIITALALSDRENIVGVKLQEILKKNDLLERFSSLGQVIALDQYQPL